MTQLNDVRVAILATDGFEETELTEPKKALEQAGAHVTVLSLKSGQIQGMRHDKEPGATVPVDGSLDEADPHDFDAVHLPGGTVNADSLRMNPQVQRFLRSMQASGKPISGICHAPWELVSAGLVRGRTLTSYYTVQDDIRNAGGTWLNEAVVEDENWITSRQPDDLPAFNKAIVEVFARAKARGHA
ncbi:MAG TPA: type 1 glutamine amidotransferase domain-containing protein [Pirellulales bacterium]|nr:type 1 glutamine amidotransferase domain-containing protein [Pirellulales bacterium]